MVLDLSLVAGVHTKVAGVDHRVFWWTQKKLEGHRRNKEGPKETCSLGNQGKWGIDQVIVSPLIHSLLLNF